LNNNKLINEKLICAFRWSVLPSFMKMHGPKNKIFHGLNLSSHSVVVGSNRALNINEYQVCLLGGKGRWCLGLITLPPSCADCLEIPWESRPPGAQRACPGL